MFLLCWNFQHRTRHRFWKLVIAVVFLQMSLSFADHNSKTDNHDNIFFAGKTQKISPFFPGMAADIEINNLDQEGRECYKDIQTLQQSLTNGYSWASMMLNASAVYPAEPQHVSYYHLGNFDGCMAAARKSPIGARYCLAKLSTREEIPTRNNITDVCSDWSIEAETDKLDEESTYVAMCVPKSCHPKQLQSLVQMELQSKQFKFITTYVSPELCTDDSSPSNTGLIIYSLVVAALIGFATLATWLDSQNLVSSTGKFKWILFWSVLYRWKEFWSPEKNVRGVPLQFLSVFRLISILLIVVSHHCSLIPRTAITVRHFFTEEDFLHPIFTPMSHPYVIMYTVFYLSGVFLALTTTGTIKSAVILRYLRLTPSYMAVAAFYALAYKPLGSGPLWKTIIYPEADACANLWWKNFLYIHNYLPPPSTQFCMPQTWSSAVDFQFFILGTMLLITLRKWKKLGISLFAVAMSLSMLIPFATILAGIREPTWKFPPRVLENIWVVPKLKYYMRSEHWATPYLIGMCTGLLLEKSVKDGHTLSSRTVNILIPGTTAVLAVVLGSQVYWSYPGVPQNSLFGALFATSTTTIWSICLSLLTAALALGPRTWLLSFLDCQLLVTFGRLTYSFYLVHWGFQMVHAGLRRTARYVTYFDLAVSSTNEIIIMTPLCLTLYFLVEAPIRELSKDLLKPKGN